MHKTFLRLFVCLTVLVCLLPTLAAEASPIPTASPIETAKLSFAPNPIPRSQPLAAVVNCADIATTGVLQAECEALVALYNSTTGSGWTNNTGWLSATSVGTWYGVVVTDEHVTSLELGFNNLSGTIPTHLSDLTYLLSLNLSENQLTGSIPTQLGNLSSLQGLSLWFNQLSGTIPTQLGNLSNLSYLYLMGNNLEGSIPEELGNLTKLTRLELSSNQLTGSIPTGLGNLTKLETLSLYNNQLAGSIPHELGYLANLDALDLSYNQLTGSIPSQLGNLTLLYWLNLDSNPLTGSIPLSFTGLTTLGHFTFRDTNLCEPANATYQAWKATVSEYFGTEEVCGYNIYLPLVLNGSACTKAPTLLEPANGSQLDNLIPMFSVDLGIDPSMTEYRISIARDVNFTQTYFSLSGGPQSTIESFRFSTNIDPSITLYWRAYKKCNNVQSPYSPTWSFTTGSGGTILPAPNLVKPADDFMLPSLSVELEWSPVVGATEYVVHWTEAGYGGYNYQYTASTKFTLTYLEPNTTYDWWITARNAYAWGNDSVKWQFTTPAGTQSTTQINLKPAFIVEQDGLTFRTFE